MTETLAQTEVRCVKAHLSLNIANSTTKRDNNDKPWNVENRLVEEVMHDH